MFSIVTASGWGQPEQVMDRTNQSNTQGWHLLCAFCAFVLAAGHKRSSLIAITVPAGGTFDRLSSQLIVYSDPVVNLTSVGKLHL
jgi:hypothetical protein